MGRSRIGALPLLLAMLIAVVRANVVPTFSIDGRRTVAFLLAETLSV